ncbi:cyclin-like protein [Chaetomium tenue]|uniref:Cyclin-like protein n=1 Tax=Chaetomium tenue TaxID=1854479 RepID=A0ACB7PH42_9PEZI|nr:cyclin-like protein [Chaetomium globosum]
MAKAYVTAHQIEEESKEEEWDVRMVAEYGDEIFAYMRDLEARMLPNAHYMDDQTEIQWPMRSVLMDWLVQVRHMFCLLPETPFLAVNYIDRFLSVKAVPLGKLQLVGATALFVAAKYEDIHCPSVQDIVYTVGSGCSVHGILQAERFMLSMLHFELGWPSPMSFLHCIGKAAYYNLETQTLAKYFLEITILDECFVSSPSSFLAAGGALVQRRFASTSPCR